MSENLRESLSALMDDEANELEVQRLLARGGEDEPLRQTWVRYNLARDALKGSTIGLPQVDISHHVRTAIEAGEHAGGARVGLRERLLRPVASFAVAASVAAMVIIGGQQLAQVDNPAGFAGDNALATSASPVGMLNSLGATPIQASFGTQSVPVLLPATRTAYQELARQRMGRYMQEHAQHAALNSPQGLIPFARVPEIRE
jgi:sigma-E factor negative regulatory protein RseA